MKTGIKHANPSDMPTQTVAMTLAEAFAWCERHANHSETIYARGESGESMHAGHGTGRYRGCHGATIVWPVGDGREMRWYLTDGQWEGKINQPTKE